MRQSDKRQKEEKKNFINFIIILNRKEQFAEITNFWKTSNYSAECLLLFHFLPSFSAFLFYIIVKS